MSTEIPTFPHKYKPPIPLPVTAIVSIFAGMAGAALLFLFFPGFRQAEIPPGTQTVIVQEPGKVVIEEGVRANDIARQVASQLVSVHKKESAIVIDEETYYDPIKAIANGIMLTSDGWFAFISPEVSLGDMAVIGDQQFTIRRILKDPASPYFLGKVAAVSQQSAGFASVSDVQPGMTVVAVSPQQTVQRTTLRTVIHSLSEIGIDSTDQLSRAHLVDSQLQNGAALFSLGGQFIGLAVNEKNTKHVVLPSRTLQSLLQKVLSNNQATRIFLGINSLFVYKDPTAGEAIAIENQPIGSPAVRAGLLPGDQIVSINGQQIRQPGDLFAFSQQLAPGNTARISVVRNKEQKELLVTVTEQKK